MHATVTCFCIFDTLAYWEPGLVPVLRGGRWRFLLMPRAVDEQLRVATVATGSLNG
jgi:hypothetical protein